MSLVERFIKYVKIDTESNPHSNEVPSTKKQFDLANLLVNELKELKVDDVKLSKEGIVYAYLKGNIKTDTVGFIAHMDTSSDMSGKNVKPRIIKQYDGNKIILNKEKDIIMDPKVFTSLSTNIGEDLIVTDGTTLLGGDDKAGIAEIMELLTYYVANPNIPRGDIKVAFTPDEEIGKGTDYFDVDYFNADYAYTVDGGLSHCISYENFNAASCEVLINGVSVHPGKSKHKMKNSMLLAFEFNSLLPVFDNPAYTEGYEGFNHLISINGQCENTKMSYIIRNHDEVLLEKQKKDFMNACEFMNKKYGANTIVLDIQMTYLNMRHYIEKNMKVVDIAKQAMIDLGMQPTSEAIRGGTDGAMLTYKGLLCPNLGTGTYLCHGKFEYTSIQEMERCRDLLIKIVENISKFNKD
jgi:peptidase T